MLNIAYQRWCLGLYIGPQSCQAVLLNGAGGVCVCVCMATGVCKSTLNPAYPAIPIDFLQPIIACLQELGRITELVVNIGLFHQHCSWQPLPAGGQVMWQRQAAHYWQLAPAQVYLDSLPIAPATGLLVSIPCEPLQSVLNTVIAR